MNKPLSPQERMRRDQRSVTAWNANHEIGVRVIVTTDDGKQMRTTTRSDAFMLGGHTAVIHLEGITGAYALHRVTADLAPEAA